MPPFVDCGYCGRSYSEEVCPKCGTDRGGFDLQRHTDHVMAKSTQACFKCIDAHLNGITPEIRKKLTELYIQSLALSDEIYENSKNN